MTADDTAHARPLILGQGPLRLVEAMSIAHIRADIEAYAASTTSKDYNAVKIIFTGGNLAFEGCVVATPAQFFKRVSMDTRRIFTLYANDVPQALFEIGTEDNAMTEVYTFNTPLYLNNPHSTLIHGCINTLSDRLQLDDIPLDPVANHLDFKVQNNGARSDTSPKDAPFSLYGTVVVPADISLRDLHVLADKKYLTLDVSAASQDSLDQLRRVRGSLYSTRTQIVLRQLREVRHALIFPNATCVAASNLCEIHGSLHAPAATFVHLPMLARVYNDVTLSALQHADFPNLGSVGRDLTLPSFKFGTFPILSTVFGRITKPETSQLYAPHLEQADLHADLAAALRQVAGKIKNDEIKRAAA